MKKKWLLGLMLIATISTSAQKKTSSGDQYKIIAGVRINPLVIYDLEGGVSDKVLLHGELGILFKKKFYTSAGYTAAMNSVYNFSEYWFIGFDKKVPASWVVAEAYNFNQNKFFIQTGINLKLSKIGNVFAFLFSPTDYFKPGLKVGVFIPLNVILKKK